MGDADTEIFTDYIGRKIRLTSERRSHIMDHPEMAEQFFRIRETLLQPEAVVVTEADQTVCVYHRYYAETPVTSKYLLVVVKVLSDDAFVLTAFFSRRQKRGITRWRA